MRTPIAEVGPLNGPAAQDCQRRDRNETLKSQYNNLGCRVQTMHDETETSRIMPITEFDKSFLVDDTLTY
jgi:hypothetical protein